MNPHGVITGGWEYIWAAYGITWLVLSGYAVSLWVRHRAVQRRLREDA